MTSINLAMHRMSSGLLVTQPRTAKRKTVPFPRHWKETALVSVGFIVVWEILALTVFAGRFVVPAPTDVLATAWKDGFYAPDLGVTLSEAALGWLIGNGLALILAGTSLVFPRLERALLSLGVMTYAVPTVALGPILFIVQDPFSAKVTMSVLSVFFVTLIAAVAGLRSASRISLELVAAFGGGKWAMLRRVRIRASIPSLASGMCISAPASILGAMVGDYFGGQSGLGVVMLQAQEQLSVSRTWAVALVATAVSALAYGLTSMVARLLGAWVSTGTDLASGQDLSTTAGTNASARSRLFVLLRVLTSIAVALGTWALAVKASGLGGYFLKTPLAVWGYLVTQSGAAQNRDTVLSSLGTTLFHAGSGWLVGTIAAVIGAVAVSSSPFASRAIMPLVLVTRSVPLVAMTPLIALMLGRGLVGITTISALVTVVPSLVTISNGLKKVPPAALDLFASAGGSHLQSLFKIRAYYALPSVFAAAKISMPGAILGAVLAEWLVAGSGIGHIMAYDVVGSNFSNLWASIVSVVSVSLVLYFIVNTSEKAFSSRLAV